MPRSHPPKASGAASHPNPSRTRRALNHPRRPTRNSHGNTNGASFLPLTAPNLPSKRKRGPPESNRNPDSTPKRIKTETTVAGKMAVNSSIDSHGRIDYDDIKQWIAQQEANPTPLTSPQQRAIADLRASIMPNIEPDVGNTDWVSLLHSE